MKQPFFTLILSSPLWLAAHAQVPAPADAGRSAFLAEESKESYVSTMKERLTINQRERDPFGLSQSPGETTTFFPGREDPRPTSAPLADVLARFQITVIVPHEKKFMIGAREFRKGQTIPIQSGDTLIPVLVEDVLPHSVRFRNPATGESATLPFGRPVPVQPGQDTSLPDGVHSDSPDQPLPLELPDAPLR